MRLMTVLGTRPEIIRLSRIVGVLDAHCEQALVHTGQNYDPALSDAFFRDLGVREPDVRLGVREPAFEAQVGQMFARFGPVLADARPDRLLVLGDTNSALTAFVAARRGVPVYHLEAGNRCYDDRVPEEINRRVVDHCSDVLMPYSRRSAQNLAREGIERERVFVVGNPIREVLAAHEGHIAASDAHERLGLEPGCYFLVTMHRAENVDDPARLARLCLGLGAAAEAHGLPLAVSLHPRTADRMRAAGLSFGTARARVLEPLGLFDFVHLEREAACVLTDSGTVQEECCLYRVPAVTLRDTTERPETVACGSNVLSGSDPGAILAAVRLALDAPRDWTVPAEYLEPQVSAAVAKVVLGYGRERR